ncbi:MAG: DNA-binding response regulator [Leptospiraceae bacterium]|nr:DNA-binding response regulator [Leptospiraceae bacterium]
MYLNTIVVEDEAPSRELLIEYVIGEEQLNLGAVARNGREALEKLKENRYDLCFLDINLPFLNGLQVIEQLDYVPYIIFTTVYKEYAVEAFELGAVDYLLKPISRERFKKAVAKAASLIPSLTAEDSDHSRSKGLFLQQKGSHQFVKFSDIIYLTANNKSTIIHTLEQDLDCNALIKDLLERLPDPQFLRIHKKYAINIDFLDRLDTQENGKFLLVLKNDDETVLPVGSTFLRNIREDMGL